MPPTSPDAVQTVSTRQLIPDPTLPPRILDPARTAQLATDIEVHGLLEPLHARPPIDASSPFRVIHGRRRLAAMRASGVRSARVLIAHDLDDRAVLCGHVARNQAHPASALETAWMTARMVEAEAAVETAAPQKVVAAWLRTHQGTGSEATVSRRIKIARVLTPDWLDDVAIPSETLTELSQAQLLDVARIPDGDERADALRIASGRLPAPDAPPPPRFECTCRRGGGWDISITSEPSDAWPDEDLAALIDVLEPVVTRAFRLRDEEPPAVVEAKSRADAYWLGRIATLIEALQDAHRERDAARRTIEAHRHRPANRIISGLRRAVGWLGRRSSSPTSTLEADPSNMEETHRSTD